MQAEKIPERALRLANVVLSGGALLCVLLLVYFSTEKKHLAGPSSIAVYYVLPAAMAVLLLAFSRLKQAYQAYKVNLAIACLSTAISIYAVELFLAVSNLEIFPPGPIFEVRNQAQKDAVVKLAKRFGVDFDTRSKLQVIGDLEKQGIDAVPVIGPKILIEEPDGIRIGGAETLPLAGIANKTTVLCNEGGRYVIYKSDEHGFHNPPGFWNLDSLDIAAVGDSFAHGGCVPSERNFVALIRERFPRTLNLGVSGHGPLAELATLKEYLPRFKPKIVLWFYFEENDFVDLSSEKNNRLLPGYLQENFSQLLFSKQRQIDLALEEYVQKEKASEIAEEQERQRDADRVISFNRMMSIMTLSALRGKLNLLDPGAQAERSPEFDETNLDLLREILVEAKREISGWGGTLYFVYLPAWERYGMSRLPDLFQLRVPVLALVSNLDIAVIDLHPRLEAYGDALALFPFRRFGHYNEIGHRLVADEVLKAIALRGAIQGNG